MAKSFLYSFFIHLILGAIVIAILIQPLPEPKETKIAINLRSAFQPPLPQSCACQPQKSEPTPPKTDIKQLPPKPSAPVLAKAPAPVPISRPSVPVPEMPVSKPVTTPPIAAMPPVSAPVSKASPITQALPPQPPVNVEKEYLKLNLAEIRALLIEHQHYPKQAKRMRMQGDVELHFQLNANGSVEDLKIVQSSGFDILDDDAKELILKTAPLFPKPSKTVQLKLPISYVLR